MDISDDIMQELQTELMNILSFHTSIAPNAYVCPFCLGMSRGENVMSLRHQDDCLGIRLLKEIDESMMEQMDNTDSG